MPQKEVKKLRISYTLLSYWNRGDIDGAVGYYLKLGKELRTKAIEEGKSYDEVMLEIVDKEKRLPREMGNIKFKDPKTHLKIVVPYNELFDLVGVLDIYDPPIVYEFKTGTSKDSADYASDFQVDLYFLLLVLAKMPVDRGYILHYDQAHRSFDKSLLWLGERRLENARNHIDSIGPEIYDFFKKEGYL